MRGVCTGNQPARPGRNRSGISPGGLGSVWLRHLIPFNQAASRPASHDPRPFAIECAHHREGQPCGVPGRPLGSVVPRRRRSRGRPRTACPRWWALRDQSQGGTADETGRSLRSRGISDAIRGNPVKAPRLLQRIRYLLCFFDRGELLLSFGLDRVYEFRNERHRGQPELL
jgi:hypothetical protein